MNPVRRSRLVIVAVAVLFMAPVLVALYLNSSWSEWEPETTRNFGELVRPPVKISEFAADPTNDIWTVVIDGRGGCGEGCVEALKLVRQIQRAMGRHANRATRAALIDLGDPLRKVLEEQDPGLQLMPADGATAPLAGEWIERISEREAFIVDPQGYLIMTYTAPLDGTGMRKDLNHLLKWTDDS